jgi:transcriptional regulator with XRE-family HTH domain
MPRHQKPAGSAEYNSGLSERIRIARQLVENKQSDAARHLGVSTPQWNKYEHGMRAPDAYTIAKFCLAYDICPRFILLGDPSGLRWPLIANLRLIPEAARYLPDAPQGSDSPVPAPAKPALAGARDRTRQLARLP